MPHSHANPTVQCWKDQDFCSCYGPGLACLLAGSMAQWAWIWALGLTGLQLESQLCHLPAVWPWAGCVTLPTLICSSENVQRWEYQREEEIHSAQHSAQHAAFSKWKLTLSASGNSVSSSVCVSAIWRVCDSQVPLEIGSWLHRNAGNSAYRAHSTELTCTLRHCHVQAWLLA